ncbi:MAG TPA: LacI family DNA-binding transcriptional regulator [Chloroflexota bacterium]|nr:LacI family DNA-binding transcriptional regulator [Chloroflexota bacterium]
MSEHRQRRPQLPQAATNPPSVPVDQMRIARQLGIAQSTVSRALAGDPRISRATRERVHRTAAALGYTPNFVARSLVTQQTRTIGVLLATTEYHFFALAAIAAQQRLMRDGYSTTLAVTDSRLDREREYVRFLAERQVDGLVVFSYSSQPAVEHLVRPVARWPAIAVVNRYHDDPTIDTVMLGDVGGGRLVADHLLSQGHRRIVILGLAPPSPASLGFVQGFHEVLASATVQPRPEDVVLSAKDVAAAREATRAILRRDPTLTAVAAVSDVHAAGALQAALASGRRVPEDLAITGYDDTPGAIYTTPSLTSVRMPWELAGARAAELVLARIGEPGRPAVHLDLACSLMVRESSGGSLAPRHH